MLNLFSSAQVVVVLIKNNDFFLCSDRQKSTWGCVFIRENVGNDVCQYHLDHLVCRSFFIGSTR